MPFTQSSKEIPIFEKIIEYHDQAIQIINELKKKEDRSIQVNILQGRLIAYYSFAALSKILRYFGFFLSRRSHVFIIYCSPRKGTIYC